MCLQVCRVDHQLAGLASLGAERGKDAIEHAQAAPADEAVVDRLVRPVVLGRIAPAQAVADYENNSADHPSIIDPRHPVR